MPELRLRGGEVDGLALNYLVEGRGPAVVLVHGLGGFAESWRHNVPSLAARATGVACLVGWEYAPRTTAAARAAWLAPVRSLSTDFVERSADYRRAIATLDLPVLLVHGRQDPAVPAAHCAETAEGFARATVRWLDACGHFPHIEHAQVVNGWLADFLVGPPAPR